MPKKRFTEEQISFALRQGESGTAVEDICRKMGVAETHEGKTVWNGVVHVFDLAGHPKTNRAYAWSSPIEGSTKRRFFAVLHMGPVDSPQAAVRAAIVAEHRAKA